MALNSKIITFSRTSEPLGPEAIPCLESVRFLLHFSHPRNVFQRQKWETHWPFLWYYSSWLRKSELVFVYVSDLSVLGKWLNYKVESSWAHPGRSWGNTPRLSTNSPGARIQGGLLFDLVILVYVWVYVRKTHSWSNTILLILTSILSTYHVGPRKTKSSA